MTLSKEEGKRYYQLWLPLLDYVNQKYKVRPELKKMAGAESLVPEEVKEISNRLVDDVSVIDEYLEVKKDLTEKDRAIILSWKKSTKGRFVIERHLKSGSIFISMEDEQVYQVVGIISSIEEMFYYAPMPLIVEATLMPYEDKIISDGLIMPYMIQVGGNMKRMFKDVYMTAKNSGRVIKTL